MQQVYPLHQLYYQIKKARVSTNNKKALMRFDAVIRFESAMQKGLSATDAAAIVGLPRSTLYRWKSKKTCTVDTLCSRSTRPKTYRKSKISNALRFRIQELREEYPTWGKRKITCLLNREGAAVKESTVGRIISSLIKRGAIPTAKNAAQRAGRRDKPKRPHAIRLKRGQRLFAESPGEAVQIDHMSVFVPPGQVVKHFNAVCTVSRWSVAEVYTSASAKNASLFVEKVITKSPFKISRIQVDGGSEFMAEFEEACFKHGIELSVLAPRSPKLNGHVERLNGTWRTDFYELYDLPHNLYELRPLLEDYNDTYNWDRPHEGISLQTPQEFLDALGLQVSPC